MFESHYHIYTTSRLECRSTPLEPHFIKKKLFLCIVKQLVRQHGFTAVLESSAEKLALQKCVSIIFGKTLQPKQVFDSRSNPLRQISI